MIFDLILSGGITMIPLLLLALISLAIIFDKIIFYRKLVYISDQQISKIEQYNFNWQELIDSIKTLPLKNCYRQFFQVIFDAKNQQIPLWWIESRVNDEAKIIEKKLISNLWILETIITASPLIGLLGTIIGMMSSFKIIGNNNLLNPQGVTAGVAESLIATGFGLAIAIIALFAFNFFSRQQNYTIDEMERLANKLIDHIKIDRKIAD